MLIKNNIDFQEVERLEDALPNLDILYMTRVQKERFFNEEDYVRMKDFYILDKQKMELAKKDMYILHPLPRVNEISTSKWIPIRELLTSGRFSTEYMYVWH